VPGNCIEIIKLLIREIKLFDGDEDSSRALLCSDAV
jgi:hypothetical protein